MSDELARLWAKFQCLAHDMSEGASELRAEKYEDDDNQGHDSYYQLIFRRSPPFLLQRVQHPPHALSSS